MKDVYIPLIIVGYIIIAVAGTLSVRRWTTSARPWQRIIFRSFFYALLFGIGIAGGSDADPGFALPCFVLLAFIFDVNAGISFSFIAAGTLLPFVFWWLVIGIWHLLDWMLTRYRSKLL